MLTLLGAGQGQNISFDADYQAVLNYMTTQGYTLPSAGQQILQNQLLVDLKSAGVWSKLDTFAVFATDGDTDSALVDWKRLVQYTAVNSPTFTPNQGFAGNGVSSYINMNFIPFTATNYSQDNCSYGYWAYSNLDTSGSKVNMGARNTSASRLTYSAGGNESSLFINTNTTLNGTLNLSSGSLGLRHFNRISSSGSRFFNSSGLVGSNTNISGGSPTINFYLLCLNNGNTPALFTATNMSFAYAGASIADENTDFNNALQTYISSL